MEKTIHEVVFNSSGVPDNYLVGTIRQGTKNVDQLVYDLKITTMKI